MLPPAWRRGPASVVGEWIVLDRDRAEDYQPAENDQLLPDLAGIRQPHDALGVVKRFGLLRHGPATSGEPTERFADWAQNARDLTRIMRLYESVRLAAEGDSHRKKELREDAQVLAQLEAWPKLTVPEAATYAISDAIAHGLAEMPMKPTPSIGWLDASGQQTGQPGEFVVSGTPRNLVEWAYHDLMMLVARKVPVATCEECARMFVLNHGNRRFCSGRCGNRARQRRHTQRKAVTG